MQGWRLEMEDAHISKNIPSCTDHLLVAVFDGHGGDGAAQYASENFIQVLEATEKFKEYTSSNCTRLELLGEALKDSFVKIDEKIRRYQELGPQDQSGCTAVVCVVTPTCILCANAGDSRCVLSTNKAAKGMSEDHKPEDEGEHTRIKEAGGYVQMGRVEGNLAVSRALGDFEYKAVALAPEKQKVSCVPDIFVHYRNGEDDTLLLACDGLWDVMSNIEAMEHINSLWENDESMEPSIICSKMLDEALQRGSKDNISAVLVDLRKSVESEHVYAGLPAKYGRFDYPRNMGD